MAKNTKNNTIGIQPLGDRVLLKAVTASEQVKGGIIIPDSAKEKPQRGEVVAVGHGKYDEKGDKIKMELEAGDKVLFGKYAGTEVKLDGTEYLVVKEDDIFAVLG